MPTTTPRSRRRFAFSLPLLIFLSVRFVMADATQANVLLQQGRAGVVIDDDGLLGRRLDGFGRGAGRDVATGISWARKDPIKSSR